MFRSNLRSKFSELLLKYSTKPSSIPEDLKILNMLEFSKEEQSKILHTFNQEKNDALIKLNVPLCQVEKLVAWKSKKGLFSCIDDILHVQGITNANLAKICQTVLLDTPMGNTKKSKDLKHHQIVSPVLSSDTINSLTSVVSLHLGPAGMSWAKLTYPDRQLDVWGYKNLSNVPAKPSSFENFELAMRTLNDVPVGDVYIFEALPGLNPQAMSQTGPVLTHIQQIEFNSMLLALLNTSSKHNKLICKDEPEYCDNIVYYLKAKLPARLFQTWVGNEQVSAIKTTQKFFNNTEFDLPCTPVAINQKIRTTFEKQPSASKELMSQSLLLGVTFLDLCVYKNPISLQAISPSRNK